jgi:transcriptional regulator with XRE-family HTH domain
MGAKPVDPRDEIVRRNLVKFREESDLSQAQLGDLSGVPVDAIRRYEGGVTQTIPGTALSEFARVFGRSIDDFFMSNPPKAKPEDAPTLFLRARPGAEVDIDVYNKIQALIDEANAKMRGKKGKK